MHGKDAVIEDILDRRPYDYVTDRTILAIPVGPVKVLHTIEGAMEEIGPAYGAALRSSIPSHLSARCRAGGS